MIPRECKRLAEVDFPIAAVSKHAAREKSIRYGHPSTLHLWWARRPLASTRAILLSLLLPDPCDPNCPSDFRSRITSILEPLQGTPAASNEALRRALNKFIGDFASWDLLGNMPYLKAARDLVAAAHGNDKPLLVDPFAGGGAIPLEALRLGCEVFASDLNPVACLILKVMLEEIPERGIAISDELLRIGSQIKQDAERAVNNLYPPDPDGAVPIAYLWARTVRCESPSCGAEIPIYKTGWLYKTGAEKIRYFREDLDGKCVALLLDKHPVGGPITFRIARGFGSAIPRDGFVVVAGTKAKGNNANVTCPCCDKVLSGSRNNPRTSTQLTAQNGGADVLFGPNGERIGGARLLAVATLRPGIAGRQYRLPTSRDYEFVRAAQERLSQALQEWEHGGRQGDCPVPDEALPPIGALGFRIQRYGMTRWSHLFTARQKLTLAAIAQATRGAGDLAEPVALALGKLTDLCNALCGWIPERGCPSAVFKLGRVKMAWEFAEAAPFQQSSGSYAVSLENLVAGIKPTQTGNVRGQVSLQKAQISPLPDDSAAVWFTDPPYYNAIPYSDLSDVFFVWLKRALVAHPMLRDPFDPSNPLTPKDDEAVQDEARAVAGRPKDRGFFEDAMATAFAEGRRILCDSGVGSVVFAHKTTEGWEALLSGIIRGGWTITGSWPISTEMGHRLRARESAALATSVHLICRPRLPNAPVGDWAEVLRDLPRRVGEWMEHLQAEGIRGADLVFACIGPAIEIFSRYSKVVDAEEREIPLGGDPEAAEPHKRGFLAYVWEVVGRMALEQILGTAEARARNGAAGAVEEDARLTALFLWTLQATESAANGNNGGEELDNDNNDEEDSDDEEENDEPAVRARKPKGFSLVFDVVRRFAQPLGIHLAEWEGRILETEKGVVRLLPVAERAQQLFGKGGASAVADRLEQAREPRTVQLSLFTDEPALPARRPGGRRGGAPADVPDTELRTRRQATTLDRVHAAMLLQAGGRANALRALLQAEVERGPDFVRLANSLSALYPRDSEENRLVNAMLLAVPR